jgi:hypothetical protein
MKYLVRSVKYFFYFALLTSLILFILVFLGMADSNIANNFEGGYSAFWKMALFYAAVAAVYPKLAFIDRKLYIDPSVDIKAETVQFFKDRRYVLDRHLTSPAMLTVIPLQDWLSMDLNIRLEDPTLEGINVPANSRHYWRYRMHLTIEQLMDEIDFNENLTGMICNSGRC